MVPFPGVFGFAFGALISFIFVFIPLPSRHHHGPSLVCAVQGTARAWGTRIPVSRSLCPSLPQSAPGRLEPTRGSGGLGPGPGLTTRPAARHAILFVDRLTFVTCFFCTATMMRFLLRVLMRSLTSLDFSDAEPSLHSRSQCDDVPCCWTCVPATVLETWSRTPVQRCSAVLIRLGCHGCGALTNGLGRGSSVLSSVV